ncbi:MAG TPA: hypothetical protein VF070_06260, partial [Streptosporangiaceae bacterium]
MKDEQPEHPDVAITEDVWGPPLEDLARRRPTIRCPDAWRDIEQMSDVLKHVRALVVRNRTRVDKTLMACCPNLRIVARAGVGLDNIDVAAANEAGIVVVAPAGANARSVAEHAIGLALALCRRTVSLDAECRRGNWSRLAGRELQGAIWGMLGA